MNSQKKQIDERKTMRYSFVPTFVFIVVILSFAIHAFGQNRLFKGVAKPVYEGIAAEGNHDVSVVEFPNLKDETRDRRIPIKVHFPKEKGPFPVLIVSHGAGGNWDANYAQARHLATHGYVALCLEHVGSNTATIKRRFQFLKNLRAMLKDSNEVLGRPKDVSFAIDQAEKWNESHLTLKGKMDLEKIGIIGHSYGAYTTLASCGMRPVLDGLKPEVSPGTGLGPDLRDPRIDCGVALSPQGPGSWAFNEKSYGTLAVPTLGISGTLDKQMEAPPADRKEGFKYWPKGGNYLVWIEGAEHTAFSDNTGSKLRGMRNSASRAGVQPVSRAASLLFFNAHLKQKKEELKKISTEYLRQFAPEKFKNIEVLSK